MWDVTSATVTTIAGIFQAEKREQISGVVGSYETTRQSIEVSTTQALFLLAIISLSLGVINLFPFLPLDGGHIFWALAEKVRGKAIPFSVMERAGFVGFALVMVLFVIGFTNDIGRLMGEGFNVRCPPDERPISGRSSGRGRFPAMGATTAAEARRAPSAPPRSPRPSGSRPRTIPTASPSAPRTTRSRSRGASCATASTRSPRGLHELGVRRGDTVALMLGNRPGVPHRRPRGDDAGRDPVLDLRDLLAEQITYVVGDAEAKVAIVEEVFLEPVPRAPARSCPSSSTWWSCSRARSGTDTARWADVEGDESDLDIEAAWRAVEPEDLITLIYTSGTTGPPKGVQLVHRNLMAAIKGVEQLIRFPDGSRVISWLPSAHIAERMAHHYLPIVYAMTITTARTRARSSAPADRQADLVLRGPADLGEAQGRHGGLPASRRGAASRPKRGARRGDASKVELEQAGEQVPEELAATVAQADEQLFSQIRAMLGFDQVDAVNVGAAPTPPEVLVFFHAIGVPLAELWGMSETCGAGACNPPDKIKIGTVGPPTPGVEAKLAEDGELLVRSDVVMTGYRNLPDKTARRSTPTAGCTRATSPRSTRTATSRSSTARRS